MDERQDLFDDGLGPDPIDRGSAKEMAGDGGGGGFYDPSYEDALQIMGRAHEIPSPFEQRPRMMNNPEAAELARRLSLLRDTVGTGRDDPLPMLGPPSGPLGGGSAVEAFIAGLQESPVDPVKLSELSGQIEGAGAEARDTLALVCEHPAVQDKLGG
jgi:hypothetical protein